MHHKSSCTSREPGRPALRRTLRHLTHSRRRCDDRGVSSDDLAAVRAAYDAFDRGDVEALLGLLSHNVAWHAPEVLPWGGTRHGLDGVRTYFDLLDEHVEN